MNKAEPVKLGVAGLGGYAAQVSNAIFEEGAEVSPAISVVAAGDPRPELQPDRVELLQQKGIPIYSSYEAMLDEADLDAVWLPVPIPLHRPFMEMALARGLPVMVEKPAAGTVQDVDAMIAARDAAGVPAVVGFQDVYDSLSLTVKRRIASGEFGALQSAVVEGLWPRDTNYFNRAPWAGATKLGNEWVLDSPAHNAMSHFVNIAMFILGRDDLDSASPTSLEAELYRAAAITNYDTCSLRVTLDTSAGRDVPLLVLLTHACSELRQPALTLQFERGKITREIRSYRIEAEGRPVEQYDHDGRSWKPRLERFARLVRGIDDPNRAYGTLESARKLTLVINAASATTPVVEVPDEHVEAITNRDGGIVRALRGVTEAFAHCAAHGQMLHESGELPFTRPARRIEGLSEYTSFDGVPDES